MDIYTDLYIIFRDVKFNIILSFSIFFHTKKKINIFIIYKAQYDFRLKIV